MKQVKSLTSISPETNFIAGIDVTGNIKKLFENPAQMPGCLFCFACEEGATLPSI